ncbi:MAG: hypothetical protein AAF741_00920 [Bacteroidota bacterium]
MLISEVPIGRFLSLAKLEKGLIDQKPLEKEVNSLIDLINHRSQGQSFEEASNSLLEEIFNVRVAALNWMAEKGYNFQDYLNGVNDHIAVNLSIAPYSILSRASTETLIAIQEVTTSIYNSSNQANASSHFPSLKVDYQSLLSALPYLFPAKAFFYIKWIDSSLQFEFCQILSHLVLTKQIELPDGRIDELINFLLDATTRFGAYASVIGLWTPNEENEDKLLNRMEILAAAIAHENGKKTTSISKDQLYTLTHSPN